MNFFWTNTVWYLILGVLTLLQLIIVLVKSKRPGFVTAFFITVLGVELSFETLILIFLNSYTYFPMILQNPPVPFDDALAGNLFSQFVVASTIVLVAALNLNYYWFFIFAGIYGCIEELFLALAIYIQNWYRTWMTVILLIFAFWISKKWFESIKPGIKPVFYYTCIYLGLFPSYIAVTWGSMLLRIQDFSMAVLANPLMSRHLLAELHFLLLSIPAMFIYFKRLKWPWALLLVSVIYIVYFTGWQTGLILIRDAWFWPISTLSIVWMYVSIYLMDRLYGRLLRE